jgi:hypothetical protein
MEYSKNNGCKGNAWIQKSLNSITGFLMLEIATVNSRLNDIRNWIASNPYVNKVYLYTDSVTVPVACTIV